MRKKQIDAGAGGGQHAFSRPLVMLALAATEQLRGACCVLGEKEIAGQADG